MKTAVCVVLTLLLVSLPSTKVQAQTSPDAFPTADAPLTPESASEEVAGAVTPISAAALLWHPITGTPAEFAEKSFGPPAPVPGWSEWSTEKRVWVVGGVVVGLMVLGLLSIG
jgi:hypothetical protein